MKPGKLTLPLAHGYVELISFVHAYNGKESPLTASTLPSESVKTNKMDRKRH